MLVALPCFDPIPGTGRPGFRAIFIHRFQILHVHDYFEIPVILIQPSDADFEILIQLGAVEGFGHHGNVGDAERNAIWAVVAHRANDSAAGESLVSNNGDRADLDLGPFIDVENQFNGVAGCDALVSWLHSGKLPPVLGEQFLDNHFRALDLGGIELALDAQPYFLLLEGVQNIRFRDGLVSFVLDTPDDRPLLHMENHYFPVGLARIVLHLEPNILEELGVPERQKIAPDGICVIGVALPRENPREQRIPRDAAISFEFNARDDVLRPGGFRRLLSPKRLRRD